MSSSTLALPQARSRYSARTALGASRGETRWLLWPPLIFFGVALGLPVIALVLQSFETGGAAYVDMFSVPAFVASLRAEVEEGISWWSYMSKCQVNFQIKPKSLWKN